MAVEHTHVTPDELPELVDLADRVFRSGGDAGSMGEHYPVLFHPRNCEQLRITKVDGRIVAHVGIAIRDASILGMPVRVANIGAVCCDPDYRGQGFASQLMDDSRQHSIQQGASLMLISGGRGLYHRLGYVEVGEFDEYGAPAGDLPEELSLEAIPAERWREAALLHQHEPVRWIRPARDWQLLLAAESLMNQPADLLLIRRGGETLAYAGVQRPVPERRPNVRVMEFGGDRNALADALPGIAARYGAQQAEVVVQPGDVPWRRAAADRGYEPQRRAFTGTLGIIDAPRFLNAVGPLIAERSGDAFRLLPASEGEGGVLEADSGSVRLENRGQLTALVFGGHTEEAGALPDFPPALRGHLDRALPLPLLWYGYNYV